MPRKSKSKTTKKQKIVTHVCFVIDRSGSMHGLEKAVVDGMNERIGELRKTKQDSTVTISRIIFDTEITTVTPPTDIDEISLWTLDDFKPRGATALRDAIGHGIHTLQSIPVNAEDDTSYLMCVMSDGQENSSKEYTVEQLRALCDKLQDTGRWTFTYMLANQDVHKFAQTFNVPVGNVSKWDATVVGTYTSNAVMAESLGGYMTLRSSGGGTSTKTFYDNTITTSNVHTP